MRCALPENSINNKLGFLDAESAFNTENTSMYAGGKTSKIILTKVCYTSIVLIAAIVTHVTAVWYTVGTAPN